MHRGEYADDLERERLAKAQGKKIPLLQRIVGIDDEYTRGDKIIAWSVFVYSIGYRLGLAFLAVVLWNAASPWPKAWWGTYYYVTTLAVPVFVGVVSTVWFMWGGIRDGRRLFNDLATRKRDNLDNGMVEGRR